MSDIPVFDDTPIPDAPPISDIAPSTSHDLHCKTCGVPLEYSGRGRKPMYCPQHRKASGGSGSATARTTKKNAELAAAATESLVQVNSLVGMGLMLAQMPATASAIAAREEAFRVQAYAALQTDPALCQQILRAGQASARMTLIIAYASMAGAVAPYAAMEIKAKRAAKAEE